jgi:hypothetical protein
MSKIYHNFATFCLTIKNGKMYRQIFNLTEYNHTISVTISCEWYRQSIEIIAFPITASSDAESITDEEFCTLCGTWESAQSAGEIKK